MTIGTRPLSRQTALLGSLIWWRAGSLGTVVDTAVVVLIVVYVLALMPGLTRYPAPVNDEGREANLFWVASGADPAAERMNAHRGFATWGTGGLQGATAAVIFRLGGVGVFQARLTSLLWGGVLLALVYLLGRYFWNRGVGAAATALLAVSNPFLLSTHTLRPDIQVATLVVGALLLAEASITRGLPWAALTAGILLALSTDTHLNSIGFIPLVGFVYVLRGQAAGQTRTRLGSPRGLPRFLWSRHWWLFVFGLALGAIYYVAVRVLPDPAGYTAAMGYWLGVDKAPPAARAGLGPAGMLAGELERYWDYFGEEPLELAVVLAGLAAGLWWAVRGSLPARLLLLGLAAAFVFFVVAVSMKSKYYMLLTYPFYVLLLARLLERCSVQIGRWVSRGDQGRKAGPEVDVTTATGSARRGSPGIGAAALAALVLAVAWWPMKLEERAWENYILARKYREGQEYTALTERLADLAGPGARILAPPVYWFGLRDHPFVDIFVFERLHRQYAMTPAQFLDEVQPDFVIADAKIATEKTLERMLYRELDTRAPYEVVVRHKNYGDVAIYRLRDRGAR